LQTLSRRHSILWVLLALAICPYFIDLGGSAIWDANEAFYVETPREMMERGDYVSPTFNYEPRLNKPVLSYWIVAAFYQAFGVSIAVQRFPIALGAVGIIATAFLLALAGAPSAPRFDESRRREAALWSALGLAITPRLLMFARRIFIDVYISLYMGLTLMFFVLAERYPERRRVWLPWMYVAIGLGVLTKGPIAILLPGLVFACYLLLHRELGRVRSMMLPLGTLIVAALVVPWYAALYVRDGWEPIKSFIIGENLARYTEGFGVDAIRPPWFYLPVIFSDSFPWSMFLFVAAAKWFAERHAPALAADPSRRVRTILWIWILCIVLFFTVSTAKQDLYIFPIVPAVAALVGIAIAGSLHERGAGIGRTAAIVGVVVAIAGSGVLYLVGSPDSTHEVEGSRIMGVTAMIGGLCVALLAAANRSRTAILSIVITFIVLDWGFVLRVLPGFERYKPVPGFAQTLALRLQPGDAVVTYNEALPSLVFYLRRQVDPYFVDQELFEAFRSGRTVYAVMSIESYRQIVDRIGVNTCEIERRPTFDVKLRNMLAGQPLPQLALITNKCPDSSSTPNAQLPGSR
jgi:4-amino-4-deoxy-L-arabinose transferase-like glycosyltransferase